MRVFVTGATGFIGSAVVRELLGAGHQVVGLARSAKSAEALVAAGAEVHRGTIEDLASLRSGAARADGAIHTAFFHELGQMSLRTRLRVLAGGLPGGIMLRYLGAAVDTDRRAIETIAGALTGMDRPLVAAFGTLGLKPEHLATEDDAHDPTSIGGPRGATEETMRALADRGVRTSVIRLPPIVHGVGDRTGFAPRLIQIARKKQVSATMGDGLNCWPSVHRLDAAHLFRLALEQGVAGARYHGVAEEGIPLRDIAGVIGRRLNVPLATRSPQEASRHFSFLSLFLSVNNPVSSQLTRDRLGWHPHHPGLIEDLDRPEFYAT